MECELYYSVSDSGFPYWHILAAGVGFFVVGVALYFCFSRAFEKGFRRILWSGGAVAFALAWMVLGIFVPGRAYFHYLDLLAAVRSGQFETVSGEISNFRPVLNGGHRIESFIVAGKRFSYSGIATEPGFRQLNDEGSPVRDGLIVGISYVGEVIVRLEICKS